ncbi:MAG TPA: hypothetical protein V6C82_03370 [Chroococcales cyanobacterium]
MTIRPLLLGALLALTVGCDSMSQMTVKRSAPLFSQIEATESIAVVGSNLAITFLFAKDALPPEILSNPNPRVMLGGHPVPLTSSGAAQVQASLPPQTVPPTPDLNGNTVLLFQSDGGSRTVSTHLKVQR